MSGAIASTVLATLVAGGFLVTIIVARTLLLTRNHSISLGTTSPFWVPFFRLKLGKDEQKYHGVIFGRSGSGKSRGLQGIFLQHLSKGHGVGILEPHHDLSFDTLTFLTSRGFFRGADAYRKLIYLDWGNGAFVPFNILAYNRPPHTVALNALEGMLRVWPELTEAPMFQTLFLSGAMVLIANHLPITFLYQLITDRPFRDACLTKSDDPLVHQTFESFDRLGRDQTQAAGSLLRRCFLLSFSPLTRLTLGQPDNGLDFRAIMDEGRSIIINLGNVGDHETRQLIGAMLLVQMEQAALSRTDQAPSQRTPFTLLIDEWPAFAAQEKTISHILSQARKFNLRLYLAAQSLAQIDSTRLTGALENCKLQIAFGLGRESAATQARHIAPIDVMDVKEPAATPGQHAQYTSVVEQFEQWTQDLQNLGPRYAFVKLEGRAPVKIRTARVPDPEADSSELAHVLATYRSRYQRTQQEAEAAITSMVTRMRTETIHSDDTSLQPAYLRVFAQHDHSDRNG